MASFPLPYSLCLTFLLREPQKPFSFLCHHSKVCFLGVMLSAATAITSATVKVGHHLL